MKATQPDLVTLVNDAGQPIGQLDKLEAHLGLGIRHLACSVFLFWKDHSSDQVYLLIQQRSQQKIVGQLQWANTVCGNVRPTETSLECAQRRLREELNLVAPDLVHLTNFSYQVRCNEIYSENEFDQLYAGWLTDLDVVSNPAEVATTEWVRWPFVGGENVASIEEFLASHDFAPWFRLFVLDKAIRQHIIMFINR